MQRIDADIRVLGLAEELTADLMAALPEVNQGSAQVVFCGAGRAEVEAARSMYPGASVIAVSRHPEVSRWLDAIEAGASDYCAAPFETAQLRWVLDSTLRYPQQPAA